MIGSPRRRSRAGLTLIEMMVVVGIVAILAGLLLPAVQSAREAARRTACAQNLREVILATQGFASNFGGFPGEVTWGPGSLTKGSRFYGSSQCQILPYLEQGPVANSINFAASFSLPANLAPENTTVASTTIATFACPSDGLISASPYACQSYRINQGLGEFRTTFWMGRPALGFVKTGAFGWADETLPLSAFADGLSNTIAYAEKKVGGGTTVYNPSRDYITLPGQSALTADEWLEVCSHLTSTRGSATDAGRCWLLHGADYSAFFVSATPNSPIPDCGSPTDNGIGVYAARSHHPGGVQVALADGSVKFIRSSIDLATWRALGTRASGEVVNPPW